MPPFRRISFAASHPLVGYIPTGPLAKLHLVQDAEQTADSFLSLGGLLVTLLISLFAGRSENPRNFCLIQITRT